MMRGKRKIKQRERLLLYLRGKEVYVSDEGLVFGHAEITQEGIAEALGVGRNNIPRLLKSLIDMGYVKEWKARVNGYNRRRKVYTLTWRGEQLTKDIAEKVSEQAGDDEYINKRPKLRLEI